jgi:transposase
VWVEIFKKSWTRISVAERSGRPSAATEHKKQEEARAIIHADRRVTTEEVALQLGVSQGTIYSKCMTFLGSAKFPQGVCRNM